uniref:PlxyGVORF9 protein n=1 Tax=Plutella xylostella granulovirus TaxID=98383 RepID=A0A1B2CSC8_9BBAC|nr:PlxyGVORF9 protein [Plutella xylostella granulovirus]
MSSNLNHTPPSSTMEINMSLDYDDQTEWNAINDLFIYVINISDMDPDLGKMITILINGFAEMINQDNKKYIFNQMKDMLMTIKNRHETIEKEI